VQFKKFLLHFYSTLVPEGATSVFIHKTYDKQYLIFKKSSYLDSKLNSIYLRLGKAKAEEEETKTNTWFQRYDFLD